jgi:hypothetical protein
MQNNVGYCWNHVLNQKINDHQLFDDNYNYLNNFLVWSRANHVTFLYNNNQGDIVFEVIPLYPFTYAYGKNKRTYGYFAKWMKSYKPILKTIISPEVAQQWILQAEEMIAFIIHNSDRLRIKD